MPTTQSSVEHLHVPCGQCGAPLDASDPATRVAATQHLVRLRCQQKECRFTDWYSEAELAGAIAPAVSMLPEATIAWYDGLLLGGM